MTTPKLCLLSDQTWHVATSGVFRAQRLFPNRQRALTKGFGLRVLALGQVKLRETIEGGGNVSVLPAEGFSEIASAR